MSLQYYVYAQMSAEVDYLNQQVQSLKQELEVQAALYLDKMNRHQHKAMWQHDIWCAWAAMALWRFML